MNRMTRLFIWGLLLIIVGSTISTVQFYEAKKLIDTAANIYQYIPKIGFFLMGVFLFTEGLTSVKHSINNKD